MGEIINLISQFVSFIVGSVTEGALKNKAEKKQRDLANELSAQYRKQTVEKINKISEAYTDAGKLQLEEDLKNKFLTENLITLSIVVFVVILFIFIFILTKKSK